LLYWKFTVAFSSEKHFEVGQYLTKSDSYEFQWLTGTFAFADNLI